MYTFTLTGLEYFCYNEIMPSDWLKRVTYLDRYNQSSLFQQSYANLHIVYDIGSRKGNWVILHSQDLKAFESLECQLVDGRDVVVMEYQIVQFVETLKWTLAVVVGSLQLGDLVSAQVTRNARKNVAYIIKIC